MRADDSFTASPCVPLRSTPPASYNGVAVYGWEWGVDFSIALLSNMLTWIFCGRRSAE